MCNNGKCQRPNHSSQRGQLIDSIMTIYHRDANRSHMYICNIYAEKIHGDGNSGQIGQIIVRGWVLDKR